MKAYHQESLTSDYKPAPVVSFHGTTTELRQLARFITEFVDQVDELGAEAGDAPHSHFIDWHKKKMSDLGLDVICVAEMSNQS
ncbi:MAG: hypothetical protein ACPG4Q_01555 [Phycisphaeraceae bacterium]